MAAVALCSPCGQAPPPSPAPNRPEGPHPRRPRIPTVRGRSGGRHWAALDAAARENPERAAAKLFSQVSLLSRGGRAAPALPGHACVCTPGAALLSRGHSTLASARPALPSRRLTCRWPSAASAAPSSSWPPTSATFSWATPLGTLTQASVTGAGWQPAAAAAARPERPTAGRCSGHAHTHRPSAVCMLVAGLSGPESTEGDSTLQADASRPSCLPACPLARPAGPSDAPCRPASVCSPAAHLQALRL